MIIGRITKRGSTLIEILVVFAAIGVLFLLLLQFPRARRGCVSRRLVCMSNLKGIGTSCKIYANDNNDSWPVPAFAESQIGHINYTVPAGSGMGTALSPSRLQPSIGGPGGARQLSTTRAFWMLVRSGDVLARQFICPISGDVEDTTQNIDRYYDFSGNKAISYGYQVPYGPEKTRAHEGLDNRVAVAADKGPYADATVKPSGAGAPPVPISGQSTSAGWKAWQPFNTRSHSGEGQNVLYADGHASFARTPLVGVDNDNIYTVALDNWSTTGIVADESPWKRSAAPFISASIPSSASGTDSVIFP